MNLGAKQLIFLIIVVGVFVVFFLSPASPLYRILALVNTLASTVFFMLGSLWFLRQLNK